MNDAPVLNERVVAYSTVESRQFSILNGINFFSCPVPMEAAGFKPFYVTRILYYLEIDIHSQIYISSTNVYINWSI